MQFVLYVAALGTIVLVWLSPRARYVNRIISSILSFFWLWMAIVCHFLFFSAINRAAWLFGAIFILTAVQFAWYGILEDKLQFRIYGSVPSWFGALLISFALFGYPAIGHVLGHRYPANPTFGLPCPTTIFTIGVLLFAAQPVPRAVFAVPILWSVLGSIVAFKLSVPQDFGLLVAGLVAVPALFLRP